MKYQFNEGNLQIVFNNQVRLNLRIEDKIFFGIAEVYFKDKLIRNAEECIFPELATPDGMEIDHYEFVQAEQSDNEITIHAKPYFRVAHRMEWTEHAMHMRINTSSWTRKPYSPQGSFFKWVIKEESETYDAKQYAGFSYGFHYCCPGYKIYQIEDKATWEIGGDAHTNTFVMRGAFNKPVAKLEKDVSYYSGWNMPGIANPYIFQHLPLYTQLQGFTFQFDSENVLVTVHERPSHVRSLFQKEKNDCKLLHFNQFCFNLTDEIRTPSRKILVADVDCTKEHIVFNHFLRVRDAIHKKIRDYYGVKMDDVRPSAHVETWDIANTENFGSIFEQLNKWGIRRAFVMPLWRSNETDIVPRFKNDRDKFGILGNMCCPLELEIAECYGGWEGLRNKILKRAVELGIDTYTWFGSHFSSNTNLDKKIKDLFAKDVSGQFNRNNYGHVLFAVNQNSKSYQEYLLNAFKKAKDCGLKGVFRDSHFNMASDTINYLHIEYEKQQEGTTADRIGFIKDECAGSSDMILSMHDTEAEIQRKFQNELGLLYYVESQGVLGTPMAGTNYDWVRGFEFIYSNMETGMNHEKVKAYGDEPEMAYFRGLSAKFIYQLFIEVNKFPLRDSVEEWWDEDVLVPYIKAYNAVEPYMKQMWVLEDDRGILWKDANQNIEVVFSYKDFEYSREDDREVIDVIANETLKGNNILMQGKRIYMIK